MDLNRVILAKRQLQNFVSTQLEIEGRSFKTLANYRSAFYSEFENTELGKPPPNVEEDMRKLFSGLKRRYAEKCRDGKGHQEKEKDAISFSSYEAVCKAFLKRSNKDSFVEGLCFWTIDWSMIGRPDNIGPIVLDRIGVSGDALTLRLTKGKKQQEGDANAFAHAFHIYSNPLNPMVCPVLWLSLHLMLHGEGMSNGKLFAGPRPSAAIGNMMNAIREDTEVQEALLAEGKSVSSLGLYSARKAAATFVMSGVTDGPSYFSVKHRMLHKAGTVDDVYMKFAVAGDQYVGRTLSGLPLQSVKFATLPPHFVYSEEWPKERVDALMFRCFPDALVNRQGFYPVLQMCFASAVYHSEWLMDNVCADSVIRNLCVFTHNIGRCLMASGVVRSGLQSDCMVATGLPSNVRFFGEFAEIKESLKELNLVKEDLAACVVDAVKKGVEEHSLEIEQMTPARVLSQANQYSERTYDRMISLFENLARSLGVAFDPNSPSERASIGEADSQPEDSWAFFTWRGKSDQLVPEDWQPPLQTNWPRGAELWYLGIPSERIRPLRDMKGNDMPTEAARRRLGDFRTAFHRVEEFMDKIRKPRYPNPRVLLNSSSRPSESLVQLRPLHSALSHIMPLMEAVSEVSEGTKHQRSIVSRLKISTVGKRLRGKKGEKVLCTAVARVKRRREEDQRDAGAQNL